MNMQSENRKNGDKAEKAVIEHLEELGFDKIDKQATPIKIIRVVRRAGAKVLGWFFHAEKAPIDFICLKDGIYYSIEAKHTADDSNLHYSRISQKCVDEMNKTLEDGGKCFVAWINYKFDVKLIEIFEPDLLMKRGSFKK